MVKDNDDYAPKFSAIQSDNNTFSENAAGPSTFNAAGTSYANVATAWKGVTIANVGNLAGTSAQQDALSTVLDV